MSSAFKLLSIILLVGSIAQRFAARTSPWFTVVVQPVYTTDPDILSWFGFQPPANPEDQVSTMSLGETVLLYSCPEEILEVTSQSTQDYVQLWQKRGSVMVCLQIVGWAICLVANRKMLPKLSPLQFALLSIGCCIVSIVILTLLGPPVSCPGTIVGVRLKEATVAWSTVQQEIVGTVLGIGAAASAIIGQFDFRTQESEQAKLRNKTQPTARSSSSEE